MFHDPHMVGFRNNINRRYSFSLKADRKTAFLCVESTMYTYIEDLSAPKKWFKANVDEIMKYYGDRHPITKEDLFLGTGDPLRLELRCSPLFL
jgi:abelson tyrosine-protein kinase 1